ncbi:MAG: PKD domain-containing protein [Chloroflexi bacterium]|nr:PKD domain-containing protein [Chloroflexota bacterium]
MPKRRPALPFVLAGVAALVLIGIAGAACGGGGGEGTSSGGVSGELSLGEFAEAARASVAEGGADIAVALPGDPLHGLELKVPAGSYQGSRDFIVSYRPITGHSYDDRINPLSPLIRVETGGGYADEVMTVKVPVQVPEGHFAMAFFYDRDTGALEGMPVLAEDGSSVTIATRHFSDFFISSILESALLNITVDSGFRPGVDDWQFVNNGSYIEQGGHCAGQSIAAMWYYYERKLRSEPDLYGRYDNYLSDEEKTPALWEDDNLAYRLASTVQKDLKWEIVANLLRSLRGTDDTLQMLAFAYALHVTHAPQLVGLIDSAAGSGHAVVAYKIEGGNIWIADPNFPGVKSADGKIEFVNGVFKPYRSALTADSDPTNFDKIGYNAVSALVDWEAVGARFAEMEGGAVGGEYFPQYTVSGASNALAERIPLIDGVPFPDPQFKVYVLVDDVLFEAISVLRPGETALGTPHASIEEPSIPLDPGENRLGIAIWNSRLNAKGNYIYDYIDFYRVTVIYNQVTIAPDRITGNPGDDLSFAATMPAQVEDARYEWDYGDGTPKENLTLKAMHVFAKQGEYPVTLTVYDGKDRLVGRGEAIAKIGASTGTPAQATTPAAQEGTGQWVLKYVDTDFEKYETQFGYPGLACSGGTTAASTETGATTTQSGGCQVTGAVVANGTSQHSWSRPPDRLTPGQEVTGTLTASQSGLCSWQGPTTEELCRYWTTTDLIVLLADSLRGEPWRGSDIVYSLPGEERANAKDRPTSSFAWEAPDNRRGNKSLVVKFTAGQQNAQHVSTVFWYEWQEP